MDMLPWKQYIHTGNDTFRHTTSFSKLAKGANGEIQVHDNGTSYTYWCDGVIDTSYSQYETIGSTWVLLSSINVKYYPNGTIIIHEYITEYGSDDMRNTQSVRNNFYVSENITEYTKPIQTYEQILNKNLNPIQKYDDAAEAFINRTREPFVNREFVDNFNKTQLNEESIVFFTADYCLYWWDFKSGYDLVLAEVGWNNSITQEIALVRGAASLQNKQWGTIITWKYKEPPYLTDGMEMFEQMKTAYEAGAEYVLIFNYSEDIENPNTLQEEHYQALERFWRVFTYREIKLLFEFE